MSEEIKLIMTSTDLETAFIAMWPFLTFLRYFETGYLWMTTNEHETKFHESIISKTSFSRSSYIFIFTYIVLNLILYVSLHKFVSSH